MIEFRAGDGTGAGYLAVPDSGDGPGVLVLHAWWGLTDFFKGVCDRLALEGFVALSPDLYGGATASTIDEAKSLSSALSFEEAKRGVIGALERLRAEPAVHGNGVGAVGFSMGGAWALLLGAALRPEDVRAVVTFYGTGSGLEESAYAGSDAAFLGHFAEHDEWESTDEIRQMEAVIRSAGREVTFYTYPQTEHWFFEADRPDAYNDGAARLAWERTLEFLRCRLSPVPMS